MMKITIENRKWLDNFNLSKPLVIAGPCSAETEKQMLETAHLVKKTDATIFRAGIWKPRTRPGGFEGVGAIGLKWLQKVKKETGLLTATEVANTTHIALALEYDVDVIWIGARTAANPFAVQEIANALENTSKIVLLKNPVNPDLALWVGGLERLYNANIKNLGVIHRGFSTYEKTKYRNNPEWQIAIELQSKFPNLPLLCDPSHISGKRTGIKAVSQQALDLNYDGFIIESHCNPDAAWSDAQQQITPVKLNEIINQLQVRKPTDTTFDYQKQLTKLRVEIDALDDKIIANLSKRMLIVQQIGKLKKEKNVAILQNDRWNEILENMLENASSKHLSNDFIHQLFRAMHMESITHQEKIFE